MTYSTAQLKAAHKHCSRNRDAINKSAVCGCFYCLQTFTAGEVRKYTHPEDALCPRCGIDSVLADESGLPMTQPFLQAMYDYWFESETQADSN